MVRWWGAGWPSDSLLFETRLSVADFPQLAEHRIYGSSIVPAAGLRRDGCWRRSKGFRRDIRLRIWNS